MVVSIGSMDDQEKKIVVEFCHLLEKSKQLFNGLRDLPQYGHKQWQAYFGRTFDIYTKLWKFQQQHRQILDTKYGLKRWQIGEVASKIGQLYYHYYLRTSETNYLNEAFSFYAAIRSRAYYSRASKEDRSDLMVKKLRYYARFIVVCLLLKRMKLVRELVMELDKQIVDYASTYEPDDQLEWALVLDEIKSFIKADGVVSILQSETNTLFLSHRLSALNTPPVEKTPAMSFTLQEILIVGNCNDQVKFSELTMDMFRMLQTFEREPQDEFNHIYDSSPAPSRVPFVIEIESRWPKFREQFKSKTRSTFGSKIRIKIFNSGGIRKLLPRYQKSLTEHNIMSESMDKSYSVSSTKGSAGYPVMTSCHENGDRPHKRENPHKYLLYKPTLSDVMVFLASGFKELPSNGALLLYISADASFSSSSKHPVDMGYDLGGVRTSCRKEADLNMKKGIHFKEMHCLYPGDLYPFTRKPFFVIIDSDNSFVFQNIPRYFGQPLVVLMSPQNIPENFLDYQKSAGSLFTLFLHSPLAAFCYICNVSSVPFHHWERCQSFVDRFITEASRLFTHSRIDPAFVQFFGDDFLRLILLRYIFCDVVLHLHKGFQGSRQFRPQCEPMLPDADLLDHPSLYHLVIDLAGLLKVRSFFVESGEMD